MVSFRRYFVVLEGVPFPACQEAIKQLAAACGFWQFGDGTFNEGYMNGNLSVSSEHVDRERGILYPTPGFECLFRLWRKVTIQDPRFHCSNRTLSPTPELL